ncbi:MAG: 3-deoxy-D-manno-octulosonic acid transferase [Alphaproteobacteria bacterium]|jgi:3-deoxy-D-manno-octulosonic-acid transferase|nr:3-deoxy-D-manno-octulosonic acid transferase [Alphaproteobacteria bacterium]
MFLSLYRGMTGLAGPLVPWLLDRRQAHGKEDPARRPERLGTPARPRPAGRLVWVHGASIGEALSMMTLIRRLLDASPDLHVLLTTGTVTSARMVGGRLPDRAFHQFLPVDRLDCVRRFLDGWRPDLVLWVESDLWPNMLTEIRRRQIPAALLNARLSERAFRRWRLFPGAIRRLLSTFRLILPWGPEQAARFQALGAGPLGPVGNFKFSAEPPLADPKSLAALDRAIAGRPTWLAASTHAGEEEAVLAGHAALATDYPDLLTVIAPRHPVRAEAIGALIDQAGLRWVRRSTGALPEPGTQVYLADTLGELGILLRLAPVALIGGSLIPHGGHNPIEAAQLEAAILYGPHMSNFRDIARQLEAAGAAWPVADPAGLARALGQLFADPDARDRLVGAARTVVAENGAIVDRALEALAPLLFPAAADGRPAGPGVRPGPGPGEGGAP